MKLIARPVMNKYNPDAPIAAANPVLSFLLLPSSTESEDALYGSRSAATPINTAATTMSHAMLSKKSNDGTAISSPSYFIFFMTFIFLFLD
jgi:hypothetical protein